MVWQSNGSVAGRRFDDNTQPLGLEFPVNSSPVGFAPDPSIGVAQDGSFLVAWCAAGINAQRFATDTTPVGPELVIADHAYVGSGITSVGASQFVVGWTNADYQGQARVVDGHGESSPFRLADKGDQYNVAAAGNGDGSYRVVWYDGGDLIQGRAFTGPQPAGDVFDVAKVSSGFLQGPSTCTEADGGFVVSWASYGPMGSEPALYRQYNSGGEPLSSPQPLTPEHRGPYVSQARPMVACGPQSDFAAVWAEPLGTRQVIRGRRFGPDGPAGGSDFTIGLRDGADGDGGAVARLTGGDWVVTWTDCAMSGECDVYGQRFTPAVGVDCAGDCNRDRRVTIDELTLAIGISITDDPVLMKSCLTADSNLDYAVTIDELITAVGRSLGGCR